MWVHSDVKLKSLRDFIALFLMWILATTAKLWPSWEISLRQEKQIKQTLGNRKWCIDKYERLYGPTLDLIRLQKWLVGIWTNLLLFWFHCSYTLSIYVLHACAMNAYKVEKRFVCSWTMACRGLPVRNMSLLNLPSCPHVDGAVETI